MRPEYALPLPARLNAADGPSSEERRARVRAFLTEASPPAEVRRVMETPAGYDPAVWKLMAERHQLQGLLVPGQLGGSAGGWPEMAVVLQEMGRALLCAPYLSSSVLAPAAILHSADERAQREQLPAIASGRLVATVALTDDHGGTGTGNLAATASGPAGRYALDGHQAFVLDGHTADVVILSARTLAGPSLFMVHGDAPGLGRTPTPTMDQTRKLARLQLSATPAQLLGHQGSATDVLRRVAALGAVALAAEQVGGAQRCLEMAVEHARTRYQFGRPIGSFQAVKHTCADMLIAVESARSAVDHATRAAHLGSADLPVAASLAKVFCSEAYFRVAADNVQIHGATGFSWGHDAHLYLKRATSSKLLFGDPFHHRRLLGERIGL